MADTSAPFDFGLRDKLLRNPENAALYLAECLEDGDTDLFQAALRNVAKAQEGRLNPPSCFVSVAKQAEDQ